MRMELDLTYTRLAKRPGSIESMLIPCRSMISILSDAGTWCSHYSFKPVCFGVRFYFVLGGRGFARKIWSSMKSRAARI